MATLSHQERCFLETQLQQAIALGQLTVVYQPKVEPRSGIVSSFEALLRWHHPQLGAVSPSVFIPIAEEIGFIQALGDWVLQQAIAQIKIWQSRYRHSIKMAVNVSAHQIADADFATRLQALLEQHQLAPQSLELEITESILIEDFQKIRFVLESLQKLGVKIAIDDFGTGYASFNYARLFAWDTLKLDRCFVSNLHQDKVNAAITKNLINMSHDLGFKVVAEGVEHPDELAMLKRYGCDEVQGYYFSQPLAARLIEDRYLRCCSLNPETPLRLVA